MNLVRLTDILPYRINGLFHPVVIGMNLTSAKECLAWIDFPQIRYGESHITPVSNLGFSFPSPFD